MTKTVVVVAAHADDEALGCGGTIARHAADGDIIHVVFVADGVTSRVQSGQNDLRERKAAAINAHAILGVSYTHYLGFPDNKLDSVPLLDVVQSLEKVLFKIAPQTMYTHHNGDLNVDHRITHRAAMTACRPQPYQTVREIFTFEVVSSTEWAAPMETPFLPTAYVDISGFLETKISALQAYDFEMRDPPHARSLRQITSLACVRGQTMGCDAAEAFMLIRLLR